MIEEAISKRYLAIWKAVQLQFLIETIKQNSDLVLRWINQQQLYGCNNTWLPSMCNGLQCACAQNLKM
jgi:hypothetical protein